MLAGPDGGKKRELRERIRRYGVERAFRLLGPRKDVPEILAGWADVLVLPSWPTRCRWWSWRP